MMREEEETLSKRAISVLINMQYYLTLISLYQFLMFSSAWNYIIHNVRKQGSLLVTVPSLQESLMGLQVCSYVSYC
jgi:hypothetical protein